MEDPRYFRKTMTELTNIELYLQSIHKKAFRSRMNSQTLLSNVTEEFLPLLSDCTKKLRESRTMLGEKLQEIKNILQLLEEELYSNPFLKV